MSDNKRYYYLKIKETFFDGEEMKILESQQNGIIYQNLYLKMCLLSVKSGGALLFKDAIPYDVNMLSSVLRVNIDTVKTGIEMFSRLGLVEILDSGVIYILDIQALIGQSSSEGERKKLYRAKIKRIKKISSGQTSGQTSSLVPQKTGQRTPELELKTDTKTETKKEKDSPLSFESICKQISQEWNTRKLGPQFRFTTSLGLNAKEREGFSICVGRYSFAEILKAFDNFGAIISNNAEYDAFPRDYRLPGFLASGVEQYLDDARPFDRCRKKQSVDPRVLVPAEPNPFDAKNPFGGDS